MTDGLGWSLGLLFNDGTFRLLDSSGEGTRVGDLIGVDAGNELLVVYVST